MTMEVLSDSTEQQGFSPSKFKHASARDLSSVAAVSKVHSVQVAHFARRLPGWPHWLTFHLRPQGEVQEVYYRRLSRY
jgi:hypothetical protein